MNNENARFQVIFIVYMILVTLLLINMLIAMMGNTYCMVNEAQLEWLRQASDFTTLNIHYLHGLTLRVFINVLMWFYV